MTRLSVLVTFIACTQILSATLAATATAAIPSTASFPIVCALNGLSNRFVFMADGSYQTDGTYYKDACTYSSNGVVQCVTRPPLQGRIAVDTSSFNYHAGEDVRMYDFTWTTAFQNTTYFGFCIGPDSN